MPWTLFSLVIVKTNVKTNPVQKSMLAGESHFSCMLKVRQGHKRTFSMSYFFLLSERIFLYWLFFFSRRKITFWTPLQNAIYFMWVEQFLALPWYFSHLLPTSSGYPLKEHETRWTACINRMIWNYMQLCLNAFFKWIMAHNISMLWLNQIMVGSRKSLLELVKNLHF